MNRKQSVVSRKEIDILKSDIKVLQENSNNDELILMNMSNYQS
jgi:hypothetical protein